MHEGRSIDNPRMRVRFTKMQGAGNDFVVLDATRAPLTLDDAQMRALADRRFGVGADQILVVEKAPNAEVDFGYRIFNGGSGDEVEHCGNGARCFVRYVRDKGLTDKSTLAVETMNRRLVLRLRDDGRVTVDMGPPDFDPASLPFDNTWAASRTESGFALWPLELEGGRKVELALVSMGNPHAVQIVADVDAAPVASDGPGIEKHPRFPRGVNAGFLQVVSRGAVRLRVWERGAGETLACGTGACAAVAAGIRLGLLDPRVEVETHGGRLTIEWQGGTAPVLMTGPAETVFEGEIEL
jgi:diaminopimelate epimerase